MASDLYQTEYRFAFISLPLLIYPRMLVFFAQTKPNQLNVLDRDHYDDLTSLEYFLCLITGMGSLSMALICLFVLVPNYETKPPGRMPLLCVLTGLTSLSGVMSWNGGIGGLGKFVGLGNGVMAVWGWWVIVFSGGKGYISKQSKRSRKFDERFKKL
jgi:hypothetical protein